MQPLLVIIAYHTGDAERTAQLLNWITELGGARPHSCLLVYDEAVPKETRQEIGKLAKESFDYVGNIPANIKTKWAPNGMFLSAAKWVQDCCRLPFLWLESDCVPLGPGWLDTLAAEYDDCPKKFMGPLVRSQQEGLPAVHLTGCSIYPNDAYSIYAGIEKLRTEVVAWDIEAAAVIVPRSKDTTLIHHFWGQKDMPPIFVEERKPNSPKNFVTIGWLQKGAVLFHRCKDGSLIDLLRAESQKIPATPANQAPEITSVTEGNT